MNQSGPNVLSVTSAGNDKDNLLPSLAKSHPRYFAFLTGLVKGNMPPTFSDSGWQNVARRFGLTVEDAQAYADEFISKGGSYDS